MNVSLLVIIGYMVLDVCGRLSFNSDMYAFFSVFCVAGVHCRSNLVH